MEDKKIDELVSMIDQFMSDGGGHMDVKATKDGGFHADTTQVKTVTVTPSLECIPGQNMACSVPTLFEGMDHDISEEEI